MQERVSNPSKMEELTKMFLRKFKKIEYLNIDLIPGYERTESEYKKLRDSISHVDQVIKNLSNYEYGNKMFKNLKSGLQFINDKASLSIYKSMDIYEDAATTGESLKSIGGNSELKSTSEKFSKAFSDISKSKKSFNSKLDSIHKSLKEVKSKATEVDRLRKKVKNMRFDLEVLLQDGGYNNEIRDAEKKEFEEYSKTAMKAMIEFVEKTNLSENLRNISKEYQNHLEETAKILKKIE